MRSAFSFTFAHYHSFRCIRSKFSYKVLDIVTHSLCKSLSIVKNIIRGNILQGPQVCGKIFVYVKPSNKGFIILLFFHSLTIRPLIFLTHPTALSERSVRIFLLFSSVRPSYIFRVRHPITPYNGVIVELYQIQLA